MPVALLSDCFLGQNTPLSGMLCIPCIVLYLILLKHSLFGNTLDLILTTVDAHWKYLLQQQCPTDGSF